MDNQMFITKDLTKGLQKWFTAYKQITDDDDESDNIQKCRTEDTRDQNDNKHPKTTDMSTKNIDTGRPPRGQVQYTNCFICGEHHMNRGAENHSSFEIPKTPGKEWTKRNWDDLFHENVKAWNDKRPQDMKNPDGKSYELTNQHGDHRQPDNGGRQGNSDGYDYHRRARESGRKE